jgi:undecaprenyl-diphosphatase
LNDVSYLSAMLLGALQGLTEFLPISSSGHLALVQRWIELDAESPPMLLFDVCVHVGTVIAVCIVFFRPGIQLLSRLSRELASSWTRPRYAWRIVWLTVVASVPTAVIGLAFKKEFEAAFGNAGLIGTCLLVTGGLLSVLFFLDRGRRGWKQFHWWEALLVGIAQGLAILPGISRSGATICMASYCGWRRKWAAQFSFLIAMPAILGGTLIKMKDTLELPGDALSEIPWGPIAAGTIVSTIVGVFALVLLLSVVRRAKLYYFAPYCWLIGMIVLMTV